MPAARAETITRLFEAFAAGDLDAPLELTTEDFVLDPIGGMTWRPLQVRSVGRDYAVVETEVGIEGRSSGINVVAHGGWLGRFEGELVAEGVLHQSYADALLEARRRTLASARLYFVCEAQPHGQDPSELLAAAIDGGVDVIQLREKAPRCAEEMVVFADPFARAAREHGALFFLNDEPGLVERCDADGVHVGQDDEPVAAARAAAGAGALVGLSTHSPAQFNAALAAKGLSKPDQISAGPVWETPTKAGRPAAGIELIEHAARIAPAEAPWFAIGGIDEDNVAEVVAAGARRAVVVRAIRDADDPEAAARDLRAALAAPAAI